MWSLACTENMNNDLCRELSAHSGVETGISVDNHINVHMNGSVYVV